MYPRMTWHNLSFLYDFCGYNQKFFFFFSSLTHLISSRHNTHACYQQKGKKKKVIEENRTRTNYNVLILNVHVRISWQNKEKKKKILLNFIRKCHVSMILIFFFSHQGNILQIWLLIDKADLPFISIVYAS